MKLNKNEELEKLLREYIKLKHKDVCFDRLQSKVINKINTIKDQKELNYWIETKIIINFILSIS